MRHVAQFLCLLTLTSCSSQGGGSPARASEAAFASFRITQGLSCAPDLGLLGCLRQHEPAVRSGLGNASTREGSRLCLLVRSATTCFDDTQGLNYVLLGKQRGNFIVMETEDTGGYTVILVDEANSARYRVDNLPVFSSDGTLFATVSYDVDAGYVPNRVVIQDSTLKKPVHEVGNFPAGVGPIGIRWLASRRLQVQYLLEHTPAHPSRTDTFFVWQDDEGKWHDDYRK